MHTCHAVLLMHSVVETNDYRTFPKGGGLNRTSNISIERLSLIVDGTGVYSKRGVT